MNNVAELNDRAEFYPLAEFRIRAERCLHEASRPELSAIEQAAMLRMACKWVELGEEAERASEWPGVPLHVSLGAQPLPLKPH